MLGDSPLQAKRTGVSHLTSPNASCNSCFNSFSYADIASAGVYRSLNYHFPTKPPWRTHRVLRSTAVDASGIDAREKLRTYAEIYSGVLRETAGCAGCRPR